MHEATTFDEQCALLMHTGDQCGFQPLSATTHRESGFQRITETATTVGVLRSQDKTSGAWHENLIGNGLPENLATLQSKAMPVEHFYFGEKYLLTRVSNRVIAFDLEKFSAIRQLYTWISYETPMPPYRMSLDEHSRTLFLTSGWLRMGISGLNGDGFDEEERITLSSKLESSQPFFEFKSPRTIDWSQLVQPFDETFQNLTERILEKTPSLTEITSIGKSRASDRGRDFHVIEKTSGLFNSPTTSWLVQCKFSINSVSPDSIRGWTDRVREHGYDGFWIVTNNDITPNLFDQLKDTAKNMEIQTRIWQRSDFHRKLNVYSELLDSTNYFVKPNTAE